MKKIALYGIAILMAMTFIISCDDTAVVTKYTVTFNTDGGSEIAPVEVLEGQKVSKPTAPAKKGYSFIAWQLNEENYNFDTPVTADITLKATWERDETVWDGMESDKNWYNDTDTIFTIKKASELAGLAELVNNGNTFAGKTITLANNIDLGDYEWTPIGIQLKANVYNSFNGTFDGNGKTISNLYINKKIDTYLSNANVGLFGYTQNGEIKNFTLNNANVTGGLNVGAIAGTPYTSKYTNIKLTGKVFVNGNSYVGGMFGKNAYANLTDLVVDVEKGSYVKADSGIYRTYIGGVVGFMGEGTHKVTNVNSNIDVIGSTCDIGGITGIAHYGNSFINCSSSGNIELENAQDAGDQFEIGGISGVWMNSANGNVTFENCSFTGTLTTFLNGVDYSNQIEESNRLSGTKYNRNSGEGNLIIK